MSKADKNDIIYFKEACDKTYATSRNVDSEGVVQQTVNGTNVYPKTKAEAVVMSSGKTLQESIQANISEVIISGSSSVTRLGAHYFNITLNPNNYSVGVQKIEVTSTCTGVAFSNITKAGFVLNLNSVPSSASHTLTVKVTDANGKVTTGTMAITVGVEPIDMEISGSTEIENGASNNYTINYSPSNYNTAPSSVTITSSQSSVAISNKTKTGFTLTPNCTGNLTTTITIKATMPSGYIITKTIDVYVVAYDPDFDAIDEYGVAYMDVRGKFYPNAASWMNAGAPTLNGIAVSDGIHRFCIAQDLTLSICAKNSQYLDAEYWGAYNTIVNGVTTTGDPYVSRSDFNGVSNTDAIIANVTSSDGYFTKSPWSAAGVCRQYTFPNGAQGYLGAVGEWQMIQNSITKINELMDEISGALIETSAQPYYWTSTQNTTKTNAYSWVTYNQDSGVSSKASTFRVRALCVI